MAEANRAPGVTSETINLFPTPTKARPWTVNRVLRHAAWRRDQFGEVFALNWRQMLNARKEPQRVHFPYSKRHLHNIWLTYSSQPPLPYSPFFSCDLVQWINWAPPDNSNYIMLPFPDSRETPCVRIPGRAKPYVTEVEHLLALAGNISDWQWGLKHTDVINRIVARDECKSVFMLSEGLAEHGKRYLDPSLWHKLDYAYIGYPEQPPRPPRQDGPFRILTIASRFFDKGVPEALRAFTVLRQRHGHGVSMTLVCQAIPRGYVLPDGLIHHDIPMMSDQFKREIYQSCDVLVVPCYSDTAGCFSEAYAHSMPVVTTRIHHGEEFVKDGETGYLVTPPFYSYSDDYAVRWLTWDDFQGACQMTSENGGFESVVLQLVERLEHLFQHPNILEQMKLSARQFHAERFSPWARNEKLMHIYRRALSGS